MASARSLRRTPSRSPTQGLPQPALGQRSRRTPDPLPIPSTAYNWSIVTYNAPGEDSIAVYYSASGGALSYCRPAEANARLRPAVERDEESGRSHCPSVHLLLGIVGSLC